MVFETEFLACGNKALWLMNVHNNSGNQCILPNFRQIQRNPTVHRVVLLHQTIGIRSHSIWPKNQNSCLPTQTPLHWQTYVFPVPCFYRFTRNSPRACSALESGQRFGACVMSYRLGWSEFENCAIQSLGWSKKLETWLKLTLKFMLGGWPQKPARYLALGSCGKGQIL